MVPCVYKTCNSNSSAHCTSDWDKYWKILEMLKTLKQWNSLSISLAFGSGAIYSRLHGIFKTSNASKEYDSENAKNQLEDNS